MFFSFGTDATWVVSTVVSVVASASTLPTRPGADADLPCEAPLLPLPLPPALPPPLPLPLPWSPPWPPPCPLPPAPASAGDARSANAASAANRVFRFVMVPPRGIATSAQPR
ncbi:hypothetical protein FJ546_17130 [Mesorhizobium sp. B2-4-19]|nr:hypothetical protein FJ546_17130 [Mesorhizobium sp. B2-4-19]